MTAAAGRRRGPGPTLAGLGALATLIAVVVGLPLALYWLGGNPLPRHIPAWHTVVTVLLHRDDGGTVFLAAVRDISWVAWAAFTVAVVAEGQAAVRGRSAPRLRLAGLQNGAGWLIALTMIAFAGQPAAAFAAVPAVPAASAAGHHTADLKPSVAAPAQVTSAETYQLVTVHPGDCLWTIAQSHLGSGDLYTEIVNLNLGHQMGGGQVFTDPSLIWPGWVLQVPSDPATTAAPSAGTGAAAQHPGHQSSDPGFSQPHSAAGAPSPAANGSGAPAGTPAAEPTAPAQPKPAQQNPAQQDPAQQDPAQQAPAGQPAPAVSPGPERSSGPGQAIAGAAQPVTATDPAQLPPWAVFGSGVLAGGAAVALVRMRRRQRQARRPGQRIPLPASAPVVAAEQRLRAAAQHMYPVDEPGLALSESHLEPFDLPLEPSDPGLDASPLGLEPSDLGPEPLGQPGGPLLYDDPEPSGYSDHRPELLLPPTALRAALSQLGSGLLAAGQTVPDVAAVRVRRTGLELQLAQAWSEPPPAPFVAVAGRQPAIWRLTLPRPVPGPPYLPAQAGDLLPGLVTAGTTDDGGYLLIDLEHLGVTTVDGPADLADLVLATAAAELTTSQLAGWYDLILAGFPELGTVDGRATSCETLDQALDLLAAKAVTLHRRAGGSGRPDVRSLRLAEPGDEDWALTLLVSRTPPAPAQLAMLLDLASDPGGIAALVIGGTDAPEGHPAPASFRVRADLALPGGIGAHVSPALLDVRPHPLSRNDYEALVSLFATAADQRDVAATEPPYDGSTWPPAPELAGLAEPPPDPESPPDPEPLSEPESPSEPESLSEPLAAEPQLAAEPDLPSDPAQAPGPGQRPMLLIGVLGTFTVNGVPAALQPAQAQLVLALALNGRDGLSNGQLCYLLGADPDHPKPSDSLRQLIVRTRRQLGPAPGGREWVEHLGAGQYALHPEARFDWADFEDLSERGLASRDRGCLREALALIRGRPFTGCYHWWLDVAFTETVRAQIVDAAELLARLELAAGDPSASARAARTGLAADPAAEQLWRAVMRAEQACGNLAGVHETWSRCLDAIAEIAADGEPHPDTTALYQEFTDTVRAPSAWGTGMSLRARGR